MDKRETDENVKSTAVIILALILFLPIGLYWMFTKSNWKKSVKLTVTTIIYFAMLANIIGLSMPTRRLITAFFADKNTTAVSSFAISQTQTTANSITISSTSAETALAATTQQETVAYITSENTTDTSQATICTTAAAVTTTEVMTEADVPVTAATTSFVYTETTAAVFEETDTVYILNTNSGIFHRPDCPSVKLMKDSNKQTVSYAYDEMTELGYKPCKRCMG